MALAAPVVLDAVLARIRLPLSEAMALEVGQRLGLPVQSLRGVRLLGAGGHMAAEGRLGRRDGWRAVRLAGTGRRTGPAAWRRRRAQRGRRRRGRVRRLWSRQARRRRRSDRSRRVPGPVPAPTWRPTGLRSRRDAGSGSGAALAPATG
ncbi:MAG: FliM/FliN family flagellar motor C-terminal domain-containing protein [Roseovarius sp.]|nr:FliM/FliN family flagellar motor C-terminal domain-containing protein [Roseovarius sp.]